MIVGLVGPRDCMTIAAMHSFVSPDPIGVVLAYIPVALAVLAALVAISIATLSVVFDVLARRRGRRPLIAPEPSPDYS